VALHFDNPWSSVIEKGIDSIVMVDANSRLPRYLLCER